MAAGHPEEVRVVDASWLQGPRCKQGLSEHAMTAACHDRIDTFDTAPMGHSFALQRLNEINRLNGAQTWHGRCVFSLERYRRVVTRRDDQRVKSQEVVNTDDSNLRGASAKCRAHGCEYDSERHIADVKSRAANYAPRRVA